MAHTFRGQDRRERAQRRTRRNPLTPRQRARADGVAVMKSGEIDPATRPVAKNEVGRGTVVLAGVDFSEGDGRRKVRPVLVLDDPKGRRGATWPALELKSSAMRRGFVGRGEMRVDCEAAGIERHRTVVNLDRVIDLTCADIYRVIGQLSEDDMWSLTAMRPGLPGNARASA